jgi:hypothetical protein
MTGDEATLAVIGALDKLEIPYMLVGAFSSNYYGVPRSTKDADFVVEIGDRSVRELADCLGPPFRLDPQMSFETVTMTQRQILEIAGIPFMIELFHLSDDPHDQERFRRRLRVPLLGKAVMIPTAEDVIITKLRWITQGRRSKDWDDVRDIIAVQGGRLAWDYIDTWSQRHNTQATLNEIRQSIPPL